MRFCSHISFHDLHVLTDFVNCGIRAQVAAPTVEQDADDEDSQDIEERRASNAAATSSEKDGLSPEATEGLRAFDALVDSWLVSHGQLSGYCAVRCMYQFPLEKAFQEAIVTFPVST